MAASQLTGYGYPSEDPRQMWPSPGVLERNNFPCVTMLSWVDGSGTARFHGLKMMIEVLGGAETRKSVMATSVGGGGANSTRSIFAKGFEIRDAACTHGANCPVLRKVVPPSPEN